MKTIEKLPAKINYEYLQAEKTIWPEIRQAHNLTIGNLLAYAKQRIETDYWSAWVDQHLPFDMLAADTYMDNVIAEKKREQIQLKRRNRQRISRGIVL